ncbi:MAG: AraC family transcriptional regulator [Pseudomonadota bacterium]
MSDPLSSLLRRLRFSADVFFRAEYCGRWAVDTSGSRHVPFHLLVAGEGWLHEDAGPSRLLEGDLVLFPRDRPHLLSGSDSSPQDDVVNQPPMPASAGPATRLICGYFRLDRPAAEPLLDSLPSTLVAHLGATEDAELAELTRWWIREAARADLGGDLAVDRLAELVFIQMLRAESAAGRLSGLVAALSHPRIGPVLAGIHQDPGGRHDIGTMAQRARLSRSAFATRFRAVVGRRPGEYVRHWRMHAAAARLQETDDPIDTIGVECGYESGAAFRKAFRAFFNEPPARYRRRSVEAGAGPDAARLGNS